jgi:signal transduction histidine kinase
MSAAERIRSPYFSGHESFTLRFTWLPKAVHGTLKYRDLFNDDEALVHLGVGKNMVRSIRHWGVSGGFLDEVSSASESRATRPTPSTLGHLLFGADGLDQYLEDPSTLWLIHWQLASRPKGPTTWYWAFNEYPEAEFTKDKLCAALRQFIDRNEWKRIADSTIERDVDCLIRTYIPRRQGKNEVFEESLDCPLTELGILGDIDAAALQHFERMLPEMGSVDSIVRALGAVNWIKISDRGRGMNERDLVDYFLTIGTTHRYAEHKRHAETGADYESGAAPTGEKGIGRLSMMRLGDDAEICTRTADDRSEHVLAIDWRLFNPDSNKPAQEIPVEITSRPPKINPTTSGTVVRISDLKTSWDYQKTSEVGQRFLSKFIDPFREERNRQVHLFWNGTELNIPRIGRGFLNAAQNGMKGRASLDKAGRFSVSIEFWFTTESGLRKSSQREFSSADFGGITDDAVAKVGPFDFELYHYNRRKIAAVPGLATRQELKEWLDEWCGGLKVYRDGVRVMPYGQIALPGVKGAAVAREINKTFDDWLELDTTALRGQGFRVNRIQVVGCVRISRANNPELRDQANREGLVDSTAARTFQSLMKELVRAFVMELDTNVRPAEADLAELHERSIEAQEGFEKAVEELIDAAADGAKGELAAARKRLGASLSEVRIVIDDAQKALEDKETNRVEVLELAATGMAAENFAHDLEASIDHAINDTNDAVTEAGRDSRLGKTLSHLRAVFKSLRTQISAIKPGPARHRRRKSEFDLRSLLEHIGDYYASRLERHGIKLKLRPKSGDGAEFRISAVEGHVRQVFDNLFRNSIYWLDETREKHADTARPAEIQISLDARSGTVRFGDTGVGISPSDAEWIFERFHSRRKGGRGLGLYLSKELCEFNEIGLALEAGSTNQWKRLNAFVLDFSQCIAK